MSLFPLYYPLLFHQQLDKSEFVSPFTIDKKTPSRRDGVIYDTYPMMKGFSSSIRSSQWSA